jgi:hypothetical protein
MPASGTSINVAAPLDSDSRMDTYYSYYWNKWKWNMHRMKYFYLLRGHVSLRPKRMYKSDEIYWGIFMLNCAFRFLWILSFIPAKHFSPSSGAMVNSFSSDVQSYVGPIIAGGEIIRRCMWGILRVELESIKLHYEKNHTESTQSILTVECDEEVYTNEIETADDFKSDKVEFDGNYTLHCTWCRQYLALLLECTRQFEPVVFVAIFIICGVRALAS